MASTTNTSPKQPLVAIVGATGTGKSQLAVELAKRFNGEIVNGDAMQLYAGMPVITNKITEVEKQGIPHHLIGTIGLSEPTWLVSTFVKNALAVIEEVRMRGKLPILVGGTHYYTQSLLFHDALAIEKSVEEGNALDPAKAPEEQFPLLSQPTEKLYEELKTVDPDMANRWHPQDRRKIQRSLMIFYQTGQRASEMYAEQQAAKHLSTGQSSLRFPETMLFWIHAEQDALRKRLEARVDKMLEQGLLAEVQQLYDHLRNEHDLGREIDQSRGIWVSIGFKEFKMYYEQLQSGSSDETAQYAKLEAIELTNIATRQYAKSQTRWIRLKLLRALRKADTAKFLYLLDGTDILRYKQDVVEPAVSLVEQFLNGAVLPPPESLSSYAATVLAPEIEAPSSSLVVRHCEICNVHCATDKQWDDHKRSKAHRKLSRKAALLSNGLTPK